MPKKNAATKKRKSSGSSSRAGAKVGKSGTTRTKPVSAFLQKLFQIVSNEAPYCLWNKEGTTLIVSSPDTLSAKVLPKYFKSSNFSSFVCQLHFYGFRKRIKIKTRGSFSTLFLRGQPEQLSPISRKTCLTTTGTLRPTQTILKL